MESETDETNTGEETDLESPNRIARKIDAFQETVGAKTNVMTPENTQLIKYGIKLSFAILLTVLLFYWGMAYYFDLILFEF